MSIADTRKHSIRRWLEQTVNLDLIHFEVASSDASFRRYFRVVHKSGQYIVMDAPPDKENIEPFIRIATLLAAHRINVPDIVQQDCAQGFLLLEDFGSHCLLDRLTSDNVSAWYASAMRSLQQMQRHIDINSCNLPLYNTSLLTQELSLFYHWFINQLLNLSTPDTLKQSLNKILLNSALIQPQVFVHRDFHSRNLMALKEYSLGIIDFQDALIGPITYDLVSLLRDCYISWPETKVYSWMNQYFQQLTDTGQINIGLETFTRWFDLMGLQRHLKAIGIFSRLHLRDNKSNYLKDIPRTLDYACYVCGKYAELESFKRYLTQHIIPAYAFI